MIAIRSTSGASVRLLKPAVDADRHVEHVAFVKIDRALLIAFQPEHLQAPLHWDEHLLGRVPVQRRASASLGAHISDREAYRAFFYVGL